ncbi:hypothetical protein GGR51DRAFT_290874 [Nemania sp. FL0031]|nr:hypothetical protein GGR51DRAFT_290874 [Nemania sp. FL0031]
MCTCDAFIYSSCPRGHCKFEPVSVCFLARIGLRKKCRQERIVNGHPNVIRSFPEVDGICDVCYPEEARREEEEKKAEEERKKREEKAKESSSKPLLDLPPHYCLRCLCNIGCGR